MKKYCSLSAILIALAFSCNSPSSKESTQEVSTVQTDMLRELPTGSWIVETELRYFEKNNKVVEEGKTEEISKDDAYVYEFKSSELVTITNLKKEFAWDFKIVRNDSIISLQNINGDAEDDEFVFTPVSENKLVLHRKMEDADPDDDKGFIVANFVLNLKKI